MSTAETGHPAWCPTDPTEAESCPGCGATHGVQRIVGTSPTVNGGMCAACGLHWETTAVVNPVLSIVGLLPTPQLRTAALLAALRAEVARRNQEAKTRRSPLGKSLEWPDRRNAAIRVQPTHPPDDLPEGYHTASRGRSELGDR